MTGRISRQRLARMSYEELEAAGIDDCGLPLEGHPPLPRPKPWHHGRPCDRVVSGPFGRVSGRVWSEKQVAAHQASSERRCVRVQPTVAKRWLTPEQRARQSEKMLETLARKRAQRVAAG